MPLDNGRDPTVIAPTDLVREVRQTVSSTAISAAFLPLITAAMDATAAFLAFGRELDLSGLAVETPLPVTPPPVKAPPAPLQGTRLITFDDEEATDAPGGA